MAVVYAVQNPHWRDRDTGEFVPKYDLSSCEEFGELRFVLGPRTQLSDTEKVLDEIEDSLEGFCDDDFLLLIGNPVLIAIAALVAGDRTNRLGFLVWNRNQRGYEPVHVDLGEFDED